MRISLADERAAWRSIVYLNLIRSVITILGILATEFKPGLPNLPAHFYLGVSGARKTQKPTIPDDDTLVLLLVQSHREHKFVLKLRLHPSVASRGPRSSRSTQDHPPTSRLQRSAAYTPTPRRLHEFCIRSNSVGKERGLDFVRNCAPPPTPPNRRSSRILTESLLVVRTISNLLEDEIVACILKKPPDKT